MATSALTSLLGLRVADERRAERALAASALARTRAEEQHARLLAEAARVKADLDFRRRAAPAAAERAGDAQARQRFWARLSGEAAALAATTEAHGRDVLAPALEAEARARARHVAAQKRRAVVEKVLARREAARRRAADRRADGARDDAARRGGRGGLAKPVL